MIKNAIFKLCSKPSENLTEGQISFLNSKTIPKNAEYVFSKEAIKKWSTARVQAWKKRETHPDAYYYRFVDPHEYQTNGAFNDTEHKAFMNQLQIFIDKGFMGASWGMFSAGVPNKAGYQCSAYHKSLILKRKIKDPSFSIVGGKLVMVDKTRKGIQAPAQLSSAWDDANVKEIAKQIDEWVSEFHDNCSGVSEKTFFKPTKTPGSESTKAKFNQTPVSLKRKEREEKTGQQPSFSLTRLERLTKAGKEENDKDELQEEMYSSSEDFFPTVKRANLLPGVSGKAPISIKPVDSISLQPETLSLNLSVSDLNQPLEVAPASTVVLDHIATQKDFCTSSENLQQDLTTEFSYLELGDSSDEFVPEAQPFSFRAFFTKDSQGTTRKGNHTRTNTVLFSTKKKKNTQKDLSFFWKGIKPAYIEGPDPDLIRIPDIVPPTWANIIKPVSYLKPETISNVLKLSDLFSLKAQDLQALSPTDPLFLEGVLIDPPWPSEQEGSFIKLLATLLGEVCSLIRSGFLFIWVPKHLQYQIFKKFARLGLRYVENLVWCQVDVGNRFATTSSDIFCVSKFVLLIFKKGEDIEIRHQRTADVLFDFVKPKASWARKNLSCPKPLAVYNMIETLLPNSHITDSNKPRRLLELWFKDTDFTPARPNWIQVHQII